MNFGEFLDEELKRRGLERKSLEVDLGIPTGTIGAMKKRGHFPKIEVLAKLAKYFDTTIESLLEMKTVPASIAPNGEAIPVPILDQKVAAGPGQEILLSAEIVGTLPFLRRMLRGAEPAKARALEVRGDSMTGVQLFDGDIVVFVPGTLRGDGIYVLQVGDELIVKRVEFDAVSRKIIIMSENPRYPDRVESADGQIVSVVGKVFGWVHSHPY